MILADALGTMWFTALVFVVGGAAGWYVRKKWGHKF